MNALSLTTSMASSASGSQIYIPNSHHCLDFTNMYPAPPSYPRGSLTDLKTKLPPTFIPKTTYMYTYTFSLLFSSTQPMASLSASSLN